MDNTSSTETSQSKKRPRVESLEKSTDEAADEKVTKKEDKHTPAYGSQEYWENRYKNSANEDSNICEDDPDPRHAWYFKFEDLAPILLPLILGSDGIDNGHDDGDEIEHSKESNDSLESTNLCEKEVLLDLTDSSKGGQVQAKPTLHQNNDGLESINDVERRIKNRTSELIDTGDALDEDVHSDDDLDSDSQTIRPGLAKNGPISVVEIGCGDAPLGQDLALSIQEYGTKNNRDPSTIVQKVVCLDYSKNVIDMMKQEQKKQESSIEEKGISLCYTVADARNLAYKNESFELILEKGTLDAMLSDSDGYGQSNCRKIVTECARVLKIGGYIVIISHLNAHVESGIEWLNNVIVPGLKDSGNFEWLIEVHGSDIEIPSDIEYETDEGTESQIESPGPAVYLIEKVKRVPQNKKDGDSKLQQPSIPIKFFSY